MDPAIIACCECEEEPHVFCGLCNEYFCNSCHKNYHQSVPAIGPQMHAPASLVASAREQLQKAGATVEELAANRRQSLLCGLSINGSTFQFELGAACTSLADEISNGPFADSHLPIVSFVGLSGAGKSHIMRTMASGALVPLSGDQAGSTTADMNAYWGCIPQSDINCLMLDTEGSQGTEAPVALGQRPFNVPPSVWEEFLRIRRQWVETAYPRLVYLFSDVVVFVHKGSVRQSKAIVDDLVGYAQAGAGHSRNANFKPSLLVVFNKCTVAESEQLIADGDRMSSHVEHISDQLASYYNNISVKVLTNGHESEILDYLNGLNDIHQTIARGIALARTSRGVLGPLSGRGMLNLLKAAILMLGYQADIEVDMLALVRELSPLPSSVEGFLAEFFAFLSNSFVREDGVHEAFKQALAHLESHLPDVLQLMCARDPDLWQFASGNAHYVAQHFSEVVENLSKSIKELEPCVAKITVPHRLGSKTVTCQQSKSTHDTHQSTEVEQTDILSLLAGSLSLFGLLKRWFSLTPGIRRWEGEFESANPRCNFARTIQDSALPAQSSQDALASVSQRNFEFYRNLGIPLWTRRVCLGCCIAQPTAQFTGCEHHLCTACFEFSIAEGQCFICGSLEASSFTGARHGFDNSDLNGLAFVGHLHALMRCSKRADVRCSKDAVDWAACNGHYRAVVWLCENRREGSTTEAIDRAAANGHLDIVEYLSRMSEPPFIQGCSKAAMDLAASNGHLKMVRWLAANRLEGCSKAAMDGAAANGFLDVVIWLHHHRAEGCTTDAVDFAAKNGHLEVANWLLENRREGFSEFAFERIRNPEARSLLLRYSSAPPSEDGWICRCVLGQPKALTGELLEYLSSHYDSTPHEGQPATRVFIFSGPPGVGKTTLAKAMLQSLHPWSRKADRKLLLIRFDLELWQGETAFWSKVFAETMHSLSGSKPCVVILRNLDKAGSDTAKLFLNFFETSKMDDHEVEVEGHCFVIMWPDSADDARETIKFWWQRRTASDAVLAALGQIPSWLQFIHFPVEFEQFSPQNLRRVIEHVLEKKRRKYNLDFQWDAELVEFLAQSYDPMRGVKGLMPIMKQQLEEHRAKTS